MFQKSYVIKEISEEEASELETGSEEDEEGEEEEEGAGREYLGTCLSSSPPGILHSFNSSGGGG